MSQNILEAAGVIDNAEQTATTEETQVTQPDQQEETTTTDEPTVTEEAVTESQEEIQQEIEKKVEEHVQEAKQEIEEEIQKELEEQLDNADVDLLPALKQHAAEKAQLQVENVWLKKTVELLTAKNVELLQENLELKSSSVQVLPEHKLFIRALYNFEKERDEATKTKFLSYIAEYAEENLWVRASKVLELFAGKQIIAPEEKLSANIQDTNKTQKPEFKYYGNVIKKKAYVA